MERAETAVDCKAVGVPLCAGGRDFVFSSCIDLLEGEGIPWAQLSPAQRRECAACLHAAALSAADGGQWQPTDAGNGSPGRAEQRRG